MQEIGRGGAVKRYTGTTSRSVFDVRSSTEALQVRWRQGASR